MSRAQRQLKIDAEKMLLEQTISELPGWIRFLVRHNRIRKLVPSAITKRRMESIEQSQVDAERSLPRRYRRALRGQAMRPAKEAR